MRLIDNELYRKDIRKVLDHMDLSALNGKTIAVTGALGLIGSAIVDLLIFHGKIERIYILTRDKGPFDARYGGITKVEWVYYDALEPFTLPYDVDYVIHCAGIANPELYVSAPVETILSNVKGVTELLEYSRTHQVERFLYISSSEVYGKTALEQPIKENEYGQIDIDEVRSSYPMGKKAAECICKAYAKEYGVHTVIARPGHVYGPSASRKDTRVSSAFAFLAAEGKEIVLKSAGTSRRSYCYSLDAAAQILYVLLWGEKGASYNISCDATTTIREIADIYAAAGNTTLRKTDAFETEKRMFNPMENATLRNDKIAKLGYRNSFTVEEGLAHTVQIIKETL